MRTPQIMRTGNSNPSGRSGRWSTLEISPAYWLSGVQGQFSHRVIFFLNSRSEFTTGGYSAVIIQISSRFQRSRGFLKSIQSSNRREIFSAPSLFFFFSGSVSSRAAQRKRGKKSKEKPWSDETLIFHVIVVDRFMIQYVWFQINLQWAKALEVIQLDIIRLICYH